VVGGHGRIAEIGLIGRLAASPVPAQPVVVGRGEMNSRIASGPGLSDAALIAAGGVPAMEVSAVSVGLEQGLSHGSVLQSALLVHGGVRMSAVQRDSIGELAPVRAIPPSKQLRLRKRRSSELDTPGQLWGGARRSGDVVDLLVRPRRDQRAHDLRSAAPYRETGLGVQSRKEHRERSPVG